VEAHVDGGNSVLRYLAILKAARDFGLSAREVERVAGRFVPAGRRNRELADALADQIVARSRL
jgi:hypothetical protein